ncbi:alpha/beta hydrolase [Microbacterium sp. H1-D42]|uniref:alpha/beta fold hydrolase n=1 Tax=Microbacterium sp. H1-D42 TaxID=2925844 RepID=UPI001F53D40B|nr:alpha/beta hydrolase [Microbacterium sp. H1-D42]UNK69832.1 alpha/beta hydrolase [Microbacterium sp. H1-D42]
MTQKSTFEPEGRAVPFVDEGEGPVTLVLVTNRDLEADGLGVISHYLAEEAGFRVVRIGARTAADGLTASERASDAVAVLDHLDIADTWIGGHGHGSTIARVFAAEHTDRVNGLLMLGVEDAQFALAPGIPVLMIQAEHDDVTPAANAEALRATAPERASVTTIAGADHFFPATHPIETAVVIEEYLDWD